MVIGLSIGPSVCLSEILQSLDENFTLPPFATTLVQARTFQTIDRGMHYIADIGVPKQPLISGPSTWVRFDNRNHCTIQPQNCAPHEVSLEAGDILETDTPIPLDDDSLATICWQIHQLQTKNPPARKYQFSLSFAFTFSFFHFNFYLHFQFVRAHFHLRFQGLQNLFLRHPALNLAKSKNIKNTAILGINKVSRNS
jgi:hypothetical protein